MVTWFHGKALMTGVVSLPTTTILNRLAGIHRREVALMTAYEIITIFIGILALLISFGAFVIALLAYLDRKNKRK